VFVSDALHAMTSDRPYRSAMSSESAIAEARRNAGSQFCPTVVDAALAVLAAERQACRQ
jgi:HD-GYP domain-containing protein (c-di-GMP phosphodiesterase class II)